MVSQSSCPFGRRGNIFIREMIAQGAGCANAYTPLDFKQGSSNLSYDQNILMSRWSTVVKLSMWRRLNEVTFQYVTLGSAPSNVGLNAMILVLVSYAVRLW